MRHGSLGEGVVTRIEPDGVVTVRFADGSERRLMIEYALLEEVCRGPADVGSGAMAFGSAFVRDHDEFIAALSAIDYFGWSPTDEDAGRFSRLLPLERMDAVFDDGRIVAGAGVFRSG